jgi:hypothetical protein
VDNLKTHGTEAVSVQQKPNAEKADTENVCNNSKIHTQGQFFWLGSSK